MPNNRRCSGAVVGRIHEDGTPQILLVRAKGDEGKWTIPKGGQEPNMTNVQSAIKEVWEEAGVTGPIKGNLGDYRYVKQKQVQIVDVYFMLFEGYTTTWPEQDERDREWFNLRDAKKKVNDCLEPFIYDAERMLTGSVFLMENIQIQESIIDLN